MPQPLSRDRSEAASPVEAAAALIELAIHESQVPVDDLSGALGRMAQELSGPDDIQRCREVFTREIAVCIEGLQFHDRLVQQLTQVRNLLASLAANSVPTDDAGKPGDPQSWQVLLENLRARFTSDSHRILFNLLLPTSGGRSSTPSLHANEGSVELF